MKWSKTEVLRSAGETLAFDEEISFAPSTFEGNDRLRRLENIHVSGVGNMDLNSHRFVVHLNISGDMIVPCAITLEEVTVPFNTEADEVFAFEKVENEDAIEVKGEQVELMQSVFQLIMMEVPLKVVKPGLKDYPKGQGWEVLTEAEYEHQKQHKIDPRLAKLKDYKPKDE